MSDPRRRGTRRLTRATTTLAAALTLLSTLFSGCSAGPSEVAPDSGDVAHARCEGLIALQLPDEGGKLQVFVVKPDGSALKQLTFGGEHGRTTWSPDGKTLAYGAVAAHGETWLMDADGSNQRLLATGSLPHSWSPDGRQIALAVDGQIWTVEVASGNKTQLTRSATFKAGPTWSPDGRRMAFIELLNPGSPIDPRPTIGIVDVDASNERILTSADRTNVRVQPNGGVTVLEAAHDANAPAWSPVDDRIAFWSGIETQYGQIWTIRADGTDSQQLTADPSHRNSDDPSWSPDGKKILFSTGRSGRNELWVMGAGGGSQHRLSNMGANPFPGRASWQAVACR